MSGNGCLRETNHQDWCSDCMEVINQIRKTIKKKFEYRYLPSDDYTLEQLLSFPQPQFRRFFPSIYNIERNDEHITREIRTPDANYCYSYWKSTPNEAEIFKQVYWDIENNKIADLQPKQLEL